MIIIHGHIINPDETHDDDDEQQDFIFADDGDNGAEAVSSMMQYLDDWSVEEWDPDNDLFVLAAPDGDKFELEITFTEGMFIAHLMRSNDNTTLEEDTK